MLDGVFSVFDSKAAAFLPPFVCRNAGVALRSFESAANDSGHDFHRYAADYTLFQIGVWDAENGSVVMSEAKVSLGVAVQFIRSSNGGV